MKTEDLIKYALIAVGGYLVWQYVVAPMMATTTGAALPPPAPIPGNTITPPNTSTSSGSSAGSGAGSGSGSNGGSTQQLPGWAQAIQSQLTSAANGANSLTADQWNYYFHQITGFSVPANNMSGLYAVTGGPGATMSVTTYLAGMASSGAYQAAQAAGNGSSSGSSSSGSGSSSGQHVANPLYAALVSAANGASSLTMDQWSYYYATLPGKSSIDPATFGQMVSNMGVSSGDQVSPMTFIVALQGVGLSGLGDIIPVPGSGLGMSFTGPKIGRWGAAMQRSSPQKGYVN